MFNDNVVVPMLKKWYHKEVYQELAKRNINPGDFNVNSSDPEMRAVKNKFRRRPKFEECLMEYVVLIVQTDNQEAMNELTDKVRGLANDMVTEIMTDEGKQIRAQKNAPIVQRMREGRQRRHEQLYDQIMWLPGEQRHDQHVRRQQNLDDDRPLLDQPPQQDDAPPPPDQQDGDDIFGDF